MKNKIQQNNIYYTDHSRDYARFKNLAKIDYFLEIPSSYINIANGVILPYKKAKRVPWGLGGVLNENGIFVEDSAYGSKDNRIFGGKYAFDNKHIVECNETVVFMGHVFGHWGSFLFDQIARLWFVIDNPQKYKIAYCGIGFKRNTLGNNSQNCYDFLSLLGITKDLLIDVRSPTRFASVIVPQLSFFPGKFYTIEYKKIFETARKSVLTNNLPIYDKIYFTRRKIPGQKEVGEYEFERFFSNNGYTIIAPEKLSINNQIYLIKNCKTFASIEGTIAHNVLFASENMTHQIILKKQSENNTRQPIYNQLMGIPAHYINIYREPFIGFPKSHDDGPFLLWFNTNMKRYALDHNMILKSNFETLRYFWNFIVYTNKCLNVIFYRPLIKQLKRNKTIIKFNRKFKSFKKNNSNNNAKKNIY